MADRVFCIDFGSAFTKVALRRDPSATAGLLNRPGTEALETADFTFPSVVATDRTDPKDPKCVFGAEAVDLKSGGGVRVYRNWKKDLFQSVPSAEPGPAVSPLVSLFQSDEFRRLASEHGVTPAQAEFLRHMATAADGLTGGLAVRRPSAEAQEQVFAGKLAVVYFGWLRRQVLAACARLGVTGLRFEEIPTRVTVPAFGDGRPDAAAEQPGAVLLRQAVQKAGWPMHPTRPVVTEPYSNAIGILTHGHNVLSREGTIQFMPMFDKGPFVTVLKKSAYYPAYRAVILDVGAFTTDLAAVTLEPGKEDDGPFLHRDITLAERSVPLGISHLDDRMRDAITAMSPERGDAIRAFTAVKWDNFRHSVYTEGRLYREAGGVRIGGADDRKTIDAVLDDFATNLATTVTEFCNDLPPVWQEELILTGGGSIIPTVRAALCRAAVREGQSCFKIHAADIKRQPSPTKIDRLDPTFARGGSAIGGASIYFEPAFCK